MWECRTSGRLWYSYRSGGQRTPSHNYGCICWASRHCSGEDFPLTDRLDIVERDLPHRQRWSFTTIRGLRSHWRNSSWAVWRARGERSQSSGSITGVVLAIYSYLCRWSRPRLATLHAKSGVLFSKSGRIKDLIRIHGCSSLIVSSAHQVSASSGGLAQYSGGITLVCNS